MNLRKKVMAFSSIVLTGTLGLSITPLNTASAMPEYDERGDANCVNRNYRDFSFFGITYMDGLGREHEHAYKINTNLDYKACKDDVDGRRWFKPVRHSNYIETYPPSGYTREEFDNEALNADIHQGHPNYRHVDCQVIDSVGFFMGIRDRHPNTTQHHQRGPWDWKDSCGADTSVRGFGSEGFIQERPFLHPYPDNLRGRAFYGNHVDVNLSGRSDPGRYHEGNLSYGYWDTRIAADERDPVVGVMDRAEMEALPNRGTFYNTPQPW